MIAIIAILAAILFPVFAKAREKARQASCQSNEKQLGLSIIQYVQDNDETLPNGHMSWGNGGTVAVGMGWGSQVYPYVKAAGVYKCPDDPTPLPTGFIYEGDDNGGYNAITATSADPVVSYAYNRSLVTPLQTAPFKTAVTLATLTAPASTILLSEVQGTNADLTNIGMTGEPYDGSSPSGNGITVAAPFGAKYATGPFPGTPAANLAGGATPVFTANPVHTSGANYLLADGHVKYLQPAAVSAGWSNTTGTGCGVYPGDYTAGTTTEGGYAPAGGLAASVNAMGQSCTAGGTTATPTVTFSAT